MGETPWELMYDQLWILISTSHCPNLASGLNPLPAITGPPSTALSKLLGSLSPITMPLREGEMLLKLFSGSTQLDMGMSSPFRGNHARSCNIVPSSPTSVHSGFIAFWKTTAWELTTVQHSSFLQPLLQCELKTKSARFSGKLFNVKISTHCKKAVKQP